MIESDITVPAYVLNARLGNHFPSATFSPREDGPRDRDMRPALEKFYLPSVFATTVIAFVAFPQPA